MPSQDVTSRLAHALADRYDANQYAVTTAQSLRWTDSTPLVGVRVLDCTPLFRNTLAKFIPLVAAGAELTVGVHPGIPADPAVVELLPSLGIPVLHTDESAPPRFDVVLDCAGRHKDVESTYGYVELTHSGLSAYLSTTRPVVIVDHSPLKLLETMFGTGESFLRALQQLGYEPSGGPVVIIGGGKVGSGIAYGARQNGLDALIIDNPATAANYANVPVIDVSDRDAVAAAIERAWTVVTATGVPGAAAPFAADLIKSSAIVANMGVDDEFGSGVPQDRVLNNKRPVNFTLEEPTLLRYMDPIFALSNASAVALVRGEVPNGVHPPNASTQDDITTIMRETRTYTDELDAIAQISNLRT